MDIYQTPVITSKLEVMFAQSQQPRPFPQRGRRGSFNSTSKPIFVTEFKIRFSATFFCWICLPVSKDGYKANLLSESQPPVPAEPCLTQLHVFRRFFQNSAPLFLTFRSNLVSTPYSLPFLPKYSKKLFCSSDQDLSCDQCKVLVLTSCDPGTSAVQRTFCQLWKQEGQQLLINKQWICFIVGWQYLSRPRSD